MQALLTINSSNLILRQIFPLCSTYLFLRLVCMYRIAGDFSKRKFGKLIDQPICY